MNTTSERHECKHLKAAHKWHSSQNLEIQTGQRISGQSLVLWNVRCRDRYEGHCESSFSTVKMLL